MLLDDTEGGQSQLCRPLLACLVSDLSSLVDEVVAPSLARWHGFPIPALLAPLPRRRRSSSPTDRKRKLLVTLQVSRTFTHLSDGTNAPAVAAAPKV